MTIARITEVISTSTISFDDAIKKGIEELPELWIMLMELGSKTKRSQ